MTPAGIDNAKRCREQAENRFPQRPTEPDDRDSTRRISLRAAHITELGDLRSAVSAGSETRAEQCQRFRRGRRPAPSGHQIGTGPDVRQPVGNRSTIPLPTSPAWPSTTTANTRFDVRCRRRLLRLPRNPDRRLGLPKYHFPVDQID